ncbi:MAG: hypothetical protein AB1646_20755 [Thermodesulfobacteriota bacterium]
MERPCDKLVYDELVGVVRDIDAAILDSRARAFNESNQVNLPGRRNGPADAYRHILVSAELTRRLGKDVAKLGMDMLEKYGDIFTGQEAAEKAMDLYNNEIGYSIGLVAETWEEVVAMARQRIVRDMNGAEGFARWLSPLEWSNNPPPPCSVNWPPIWDPSRFTWPPLPGEYPTKQPAPSGNFNDVSANELDERESDGCESGECPEATLTALGVLDRLLSGAGADRLLTVGDLDWLLGAPPSYCDSHPIPAPEEEEEEEERADPLVLNLDGDSIETTSEGPSWQAGGARVFFDLNADGFAERTGWASGNDGLLVMDRNGNGFIDNGRELFGSGTPLTQGGAATTGFQALADLDSNHDGIISADDTLFSQLRVWKDEDEDGFSFPTELYTLPELGIASINLTPTGDGTGTDAQGNTQERTGTFTWADGTSGQIAEYTFDRNTAYTIQTEWVDVPDDIAALPDLPGYGTVPRLHQAMARDTSGTLKGHVQNFMGANTRGARQTAVRGILNAWTRSSKIDANKYAWGGLSGPKVGVLSAFFGSRTPLPNGQLAANRLQALVSLDSIEEGKIHAQNSPCSGLRVWFASDGDGVSQPKEWHTVTEQRHSYYLTTH